MIKNAELKNQDSSIPTEEDMLLINKYTRRELKPEEVYVFSAVLCDNEVDRDFERFTTESLRELEKLYLGKTGVIDHNPTAENQTARIYSVRTETVIGKKTAAGDEYVQLIAKAYLPRSEGTKELILMLDSGIRKEISVGCAVAKGICSICGAERGACTHQRGKSYNGRLCFTELCEPYDAYEWSFVAVPAQRNAGVIKKFKAEDEMEKRFTERTQSKIIKALKESNTGLAESEIEAIKSYICELEVKAADGEKYRAGLENEVRKLALICEPKISAEILEAVIKKMNVDELCAYKSAYEARVRPQSAAKPSLATKNIGTEADNHKFII